MHFRTSYTQSCYNYSCHCSPFDLCWMYVSMSCVHSTCLFCLHTVYCIFAVSKGEEDVLFDNKLFISFKHLLLSIAKVLSHLIAPFFLFRRHDCAAFNISKELHTSYDTYISYDIIVKMLRPIKACLDTERSLNIQRISESCAYLVYTHCLV